MLFSELESLLDPEAGPWMFGLDNATALDRNLVPFIAKLRGLGMEILIPKGVISYADAAMAKPEWSGVIQGSKAMPGA